MDPDKQIGLIMLVILGYSSVPLLFAGVMYFMLINGAFPPDSDSIGIPIAGFTVMWFITGLIGLFAALVGIVVRCAINGSKQRGLR